MIELRDVVVPELERSEPAPVIPAAVYAGRLGRAVERMGQRGLTHLLIWGDREHSASLAYFVDVDPRFEEAVLLLAVDAEPVMLLGNEDVGFAARSPVPLRTVLFQSLSLMGQPRSACIDPVAALREAGLAGSARLGLVGMKYYEDRSWFDLPHYIVEAAAEICGRERVTCATDLLLDPQEGLRNINEAEQIAAFEWVATRASQAVTDVVSGLEPGQTEYEVMTRARFDGTPLSCHPMLTTGKGELLGLSSPTGRRMELGDRFSCAIGLQGGLSCRAGFVAGSEADLAEDQQGYLEKVCLPYYRAIALWYREVRIGAVGGAVYDQMAERLGADQMAIAMNPGHQLHLDEWTHTPFTPGSECELRSGMVIQCDNIIIPPAPYHGSNVEDGIALADRPLRERLAREYPAAWRRIEARRAMMQDSLGLALAEDLLPMSNSQAVLRPFSLARGLALAAQ